MKHLLFGLIFFISGSVYAQDMIHGVLWSQKDGKPLPFGTLGNISKNKTSFTDEHGKFSIAASLHDTILFSYVGYFTRSLIVNSVSDTVRINLTQKENELQEVVILSKTHKTDSLETRKTFKKGFEYRPVKALELLGSGNIDKLYELSQFRKNKRKEVFREQLITSEQNDYVDYRFNEEYVARIRKLKEDDMKFFLIRYRPSFEFTRNASDYDFYLYVKKALENYAPSQNNK